MEGKAEKGTLARTIAGKLYVAADGESSISQLREKSIQRVRNEVQTIIDIMGPGTPNIQSSSSSILNIDGDQLIFAKIKSRKNLEQKLAIIKNKQCDVGCSSPCNKMFGSEELSETVIDTHSFEEEVEVVKKKCKETCPAACNKKVVIEEEPEQQNSFDDTQPPEDVTLNEDTNELSFEIDKPPTLSDVDIPQEYQPQQFMCPPPLFPANICVNSECMCPQIASYFKNGPFPMHTPFPPNYEPEIRRCPPPKRERSPILTWFKKITSNYTQGDQKEHISPEYYKMDVKQDGRSQPRRLVFELVDDCAQKKASKEDRNYCEKLSGIRAKCSELEKNILSKPTVNMNVEKEVLESPRTAGMSEKGKTKVDVYYFDHGNSTYFRTTDRAPIVATEIIAEKTEAYTTKFWAEFFGTIHIGFSFVTSFILQLFRFILYSMIRPLTIGLIQLASDYFFKPCLATVFNGVVQPPLIFLYNVATSLRDLCDPIAEGLGYFLGEIAQIFKACRLVEINKECHSEKVQKRERCRNCKRKTECC